MQELGLSNDILSMDLIAPPMDGDGVDFNSDAYFIGTNCSRLDRRSAWVSTPASTYRLPRWTKHGSSQHQTGSCQTKGTQRLNDLSIGEASEKEDVIMYGQAIHSFTATIRCVAPTLLPCTVVFNLALMISSRADGVEHICIVAFGNGTKLTLSIFLRVADRSYYASGNQASFNPSTRKSDA